MLLSQQILYLYGNKCLKTGSILTKLNHNALSSRCILSKELLGKRNSAHNIHTTRKRDVNPLIGLVLRPVSRILAILVGRGIRKWWQALPPNKKQLLFQHLSRNKLAYTGGAVVSGCCGYYYYETHITTVPFTNRRRFMIFTSEQLHDIAMFAYEDTLATFKDQLVKDDDPIIKRVLNITNRLLHANRNILQIYTRTWTVTVIDSPIENCYVLSSGHIVVFKGMVDLTENDDQLANVIAHEMSHAILGHNAEKMSQAYLLDLLLIFPLAVIWTFLPNNGIALVTHWFMCKVMDILVELPFSRQLECEADVVGLMLAATACYDVRDASAFWGQVSLYDKIKALREGKPATLEWLSTHPSNEERQLLLDKWMPQAISLRKMCDCPELAKMDPRDIVARLQKKYGIQRPSIEDNNEYEQLSTVLRKPEPPRDVLLK